MGKRGGRRIFNPLKTSDCVSSSTRGARRLGLWSSRVAAIEN